MAASRTHIVAFPYHAWGHARPLINLSARLVKMRSVVVTLFITSPVYERARAELARNFEPGEDELAQYVRIVSIGDIQGFGGTDKIDAFFETAWKSLVSEQELICAHTGNHYAPLSKPKAIIMDFFATKPFHSVKAISGDTVKVYAWESGAVASMFYMCGPEKLGGIGNMRVKAEEEVQRTGRPYDDIIFEMAFQTKGRVVSVPSMPPMYDYEYWPQEVPMLKELGTKLFPHVFETLEAMDGIFMVTPQSYEPEAVAAVKEWYGETDRPAYVCGPLFPSASKATAMANEKKQSSTSDAVQEFLDATLARSGAKSLLYISLGSAFWPVKSPETLWAVLDVVMERNIPFILSHGSPLAVIPDEIRAKVHAYGLGLLSAWTAQQLVLEHPATGWFITHGGHNSVIEAISAGTPQIFWPFMGDQPLSAINASENLKIGYELIEVRTGHGLKPLYRDGQTPTGTVDAVKAELRDVLEKAFGEDGQKKRDKLAQLREAVLGEWEDGGTSKSEIIAFLDSLEA